MNRFMFFTGICYALSTPLGVHIGFLMGVGNWAQVFLELAILIVLQTMAPVMWVKAQTMDIKQKLKRPRRTTKNKIVEKI
jgi:hypothetical protein